MSFAFSPSRIGRRDAAGFTLVLAGSLLLAAGCRNSTQSDLIQREMRHQEDQIYALQDYLAEYQQLLCEARSENESLRQQAVRGQFRKGSADDRDTPPLPPLEPPPPPDRDAPEVKIDEHMEMTLPEAPPLELEPPPAPPVGGSTSQNESEVASKVEPAAFEEVTKRKDAPVTTRLSSPKSEATSPVAAVAVRAEVSRGEEGEGPRVLVDVLPLAADGKPAELDGALSLMFLDPQAIGKAKDLARWDFATDELAAFAKETSHGTAFVFPLQLPAAAPTDRPVELWVRVMPTGGDKVLSHAAVDLGQPGRVAVDERVKPKRTMKRDFAVRRAASEAPLASSRAPRASSRPSESKPGVVMHVDGWQIARPGDVQDASAESREGGSEWRTATQPIPLVESHPAMRDPLDQYESHDRYGVAPAAVNEPQELPQWLPERTRVASPPVDHILSPPAWSAKR